MKRLVFLSALIALAAACGAASTLAPLPGPTTAIPVGDTASVVSITDGDTIRVHLRGSTAASVAVRLIGIDTPETRHPSKGVECFGKEASNHLGELIPVGTDVRLVYDVERLDRYQRTLAYVYRVSDGLFVNLALARDGYARQATFPPNIAHMDEFAGAVNEARAGDRGLWSACPTGSPPSTR